VNRAQKAAYKKEYAAAKKSGKPFFPYAVYKDLIVATIAIGVVIAFAVIYRVEIGERVNPATTDFVPRPEWYFFFLFELLKIFKGQNAFTPVIMATFIIPNIMMALLVLWPFIDRGPERRPHRRPIAMFVAAGTIGFMGWLTYLAAEAPGGAVGAEDIQLEGLTPEAEAGLSLFLSSGCTSCHMIQGVGASGPGPDLTNEGAKNRGVEWQIEHLKNPQSLIPGSSMPAFANFTDQQYQELATLLDGLGTEYK
jgi:mono/diheme cytochrome c family protein